MSVKKSTTKKKVATKKKAVATKKKATVKKAAVKKAATKKKVAVKKKAAASKPSVSNKERYQMIATMAYYRAEKRNFTPGNEMEDWFECEKIIDDMLNKG